MAPSAEIVLFDLPSKDPCKSWNMHPWKTRLLLNYKGLDYRTEWTEYPDIKSKLEQHSPPNSQGLTYSVPTIILPDNTYITDSRKIANEIEKRYPDPQVHLDAPQLKALEAIMPQLVSALTGVYINKVPTRLLNDISLDHWYKTRIQRVAGTPLDQFEHEKGGQSAWNNAKPLVDKITAILKQDNQGSYSLGETVSYADFVWAGFLIFLQRLGDDIWEKMVETMGEDTGLHIALLDALKPWRSRDDR